MMWPRIVWHFRGGQTMRMFARIAFAVVMVAALAGASRPATINVLSAPAVQEVVRQLAADFAKETGHQVFFLSPLSFAAPTFLDQDAKVTPDAVITTEPIMDQLDKDGMVNPESRVRLAADGTTTYEGALMSDGGVPEAAREFIRFLASADARAAWIAGKLEPLSDQ